jgi:flagellar hook-basal body complex protein FliE
MITENTKTEFEKTFEKSVEEIKQQQKEAQNAPKPVKYDSWQIELMHWGAHH